MLPLLLFFFAVHFDVPNMEAVCYVEQVAKAKRETSSRLASVAAQAARQTTVGEVKKAATEDAFLSGEADSVPSV